MQDGACLNGWNLRSDGLSAHRSHPSCGAWHLVSVRVGAVSGGGAEVVKQLHADVSEQTLNTHLLYLPRATYRLHLRRANNTRVLTSLGPCECI